MHNLLYRWLFFVCLLCLPIGSDANIASKKAILLSDPVVVEQQTSGQIASVFERIPIFKKLKNTLQKRVYTDLSRYNREGGTKPAKDKKDTLARRVFKVLLLIAAAVLLIYWLQGTIGLALVTGGGIAYWLNRDRIAERQRLNRERRYAYEQERQNNPNSSKATDSMNHPANKWTKRALKRFLIGVGLVFLGFVFAIVGLIAGGAEAAVGILAFGLLLFGYSLTITGFFNGIKALVSKEPQSAWAWIVVILGLPFILTLLLGLILGLG